MNRQRLSLLILAGGAALAAAACAGDEADVQGQAVTGTDRYLVRFQPGKAAQGKAAVQAAGAQIARELPQVNAVAAYIPSAAVSGLANNPNIELVEIDPKRIPTAEVTPYGITMVQADQVSDANTGSRTVCIIDSGYDAGHEDLPPARGYNGNLAWNQDGCGHGTHVAGTVAALGENGVGVVGVNPGGLIDLFIVRVFGDDCSWSYASDLIDAAYRCRDGGADVISMSLGCSGRFCASTTEQAAFDDLYNNDGILSIAAAGNSGNTQKSYPASYDSVVSVAAIDSNKQVASFSQQNDQVELSAPGVQVLSTVPTGSGQAADVTVGTTGYAANPLDGSIQASATGPLYECALDGTCPGAPGGHVCLIQRGTYSFWDKVVNCQNSGGAAAIIYNNESGNFLGTLGDGNTSSVPAVSVSDTDGAALKTRVGESTTVDVYPYNYEAWDGTSMATPHVSGVAALIWSHNTSWTNVQIREALAATAEDLGSAGRDNAYGYGLIRAKAALDHLNGGGGGGGCTVTESPETSCSDGVDNDCDGAADSSDSDCAATCTITENPETSCSDGVDNDCDGAADGDDSDCAPTCTITENPETSCSDGVDNDCDGAADSSDADCQICLPLAATCTSDSECCSGKCRGKPGNKSCK